MAAPTQAAAFAYKDEFEDRVQRRLDEPNVWKEVCEVQFSTARTIHWPFQDDLTVQTPTRSSAYTYRTLQQTDETLNINQVALYAVLLPQADLAQSGYADMMDLADRLAAQIDEQIETHVWQQYSAWEVFDGTDIGGSAGSITVSSTNVAAIIRNVRKLIFSGKGSSLLAKNGGFMVWHEGDFEKLEAFAQANGFMLADEILRDGIRIGIKHQGFYHYTSNLLPAGFMVGGVKKIIKVGVLTSTYGNLLIDPNDPAQVRGTGVRLAADYGVKTFEVGGSLVFNIAVA